MLQNKKMNFGLKTLFILHYILNASIILKIYGQQGLPSITERLPDDHGL